MKVLYIYYIATVLPIVSQGMLGKYNYILGPEELISMRGYPFEVHKVVTEDGYILTLHRIPYGRYEYNVDPVERKIVLFVHGILQTANAFLYFNQTESAGFFVADEGYDVWLANLRGCRYSLEHEVYNASQPEYWDFSWHEIATYDLTAIIDYILDNTKQPKLSLITHSMGGTLFYALMAEKPSYNDKVSVAINLGPEVFTKHVLTPVLREAIRIFTILNVLNILSPNGIAVSLELICDSFPDTLRLLCEQILMKVFAGYEHEQTEIHKYVFIKYNLDSSSLKAVNHFAQLVASGNFQKYDYGPKKNMLYYNLSEPPLYDLNKVTAPSVLFAGSIDFLTTPEDIVELGQVLPSVKEIYVIEGFSHWNFLAAVTLKNRVYENIFKILETYT